MALLTDDMDIYTNYLLMDFGGNGDYYITIINEIEGIRNSNTVRIAMSGGNAPTSVKLAVAELFRSLEENKLNSLPE
jgi:hypothetical protein